jgi:putative nucleotidyltransferase with HDIG domain
MASILVVEDDDDLRSTLSQYLVSKNHEVVEASNGKAAIEMLKHKNFDVVLSDVQMPEMNGVQLLEWVKAQHTAKFIMMTGFTNLLETKTAHDLGADEFLSKPFRIDDLTVAISKVLSHAGTQSDTENLDGIYCKVSIEDFMSKQQIELDLYVRLSESKYVKIGHQGQPMPRERILTYRDKGVTHLHIRKDEFNKLVGFQLSNLKDLKTHPATPLQKKLDFIKFSNDLILEKAFVAGVDREAYDAASEFLSSTVQIITEHPDVFDLLAALNDHSNAIYAHSLGVSLYAMMIARKMEFTSSQLFFKIGIAGLFHDIGKKDIDSEILEKSRPLLTQKERALIESHVTLGKNALSKIKDIPSDVVRMVTEHHEDNHGQGYPAGLDKNSLHPLSKVLIVANHFAEYAIKGPHNPGMTALAAIKQMDATYGERLDRTALDALRDIFKNAKA